MSFPIRCRMLPVVLALLLPAGAQFPAPSGDAAIGVWPWLVGNINADTPNVIAQTQAAGLDTIYLHLFRTDSSTGVEYLHMADEAGNWNPAWGTVQPLVTLTSFITQAHAANLQVVGVINCFMPPFHLPGDAAHEQALLGVADYLVNNFTGSGDPKYKLDGIALDRCRYYSGTGNNSAVVTAFVQQLKARLGLVPLHAFVMANLDSFDGPQPYNAQFRPYATVMGLLQSQWGQHWENLASSLDVTLPMAYIAAGSYYGSNTAQMQAYVQTVAAYARQASVNSGHPGQRVLPAIRAWTDGTGTTTAATLDASMAGALSGGANGFMPFRYYTMQGQTSWWNAVTGRTLPGAGLPLANLSATPLPGFSVFLDATGSTSLAYSAAVLEARFDLNDDGVADTPWSATKTWTYVPPAPGSVGVAVEVRDPAGHVAVRKKRLNVTSTPASLNLSGGALSASLGGTRGLMVSAGAVAAGDLYFLAGSLSGTSPGFPLAPGIVVPLNYDAFMELTLLLANSQYLPGFAGTLDQNGQGSGSLVVGPGVLPPSLAFTVLNFAAAGLDPLGSGWTFATNAVGLLILP